MNVQKCHVDISFPLKLDPSLLHDYPNFMEKFRKSNELIL